MAERKPLADLIVEVPTLLVNLVREELTNLKTEITGKVSKLGVGGGLLAGAGLFALFMLGWLLTAGFEGLKLAFAPWLAALLVAAFLLVIILILVLVALPMVKKGSNFKDLDSVDSIKDDVNVVRGLGHAADGTSPLSDLPPTGNPNGGQL